MTLRLVVKDDHGSAKLQLMYGTDVVGFAQMSWPSYVSTIKSLLSVVVKTGKQEIAKTLAEMLWRDAQSMAEGASAELAKEKLISFGWNQEKIDRYAEELAKKLAQQLASQLPEHR